MDNFVVLKQILDAVAQVSNLSVEQLRSRERSLQLNTARGVYYLIAKTKGYHPTEVSSIIGRTRASCIITTNVYINYYRTNDRATVSLYENAIKSLNYE